MTIIHFVVDTSEPDAWPLGPRFIEVEADGRSISVHNEWEPHPLHSGYSVLPMDVALEGERIVKTADLIAALDYNFGGVFGAESYGDIVDRLLPEEAS